MRYKIHVNWNCIVLVQNPVKQMVNENPFNCSGLKSTVSFLKILRHYTVQWIGDPSDTLKRQADTVMRFPTLEVATIQSIYMFSMQNDANE